MTQEKFIPKRKEQHSRSRHKARMNTFSRKLTRLSGSGELNEEKTFHYEIVNVKF